MSAVVETLCLDPPLVVDLDGTLIKTDLLIESSLALIKSRPSHIFLLLLWMLRGKAYLKAQIAARVDLDVATLPYRASVLNLIREARSHGRTIVLATASNRKYAEQIAARLQLFDAVLASDDAVNLRGANKLRSIHAYTLQRPYDYVGNEADDLTIWKYARRAFVVDAPPLVVKRLRQFKHPEHIAGERKRRITVVARAMRTHQWIKNILLFLPLLAAHKLTDLVAVGGTVAGFFAFGLCASSVYLLNDMLDLEADRRHPFKRNRPMAAGDMPLSHALLIAPVLLAAGLTIALFLPLKFLLVLATYYVTTVCYSFWAKRQVMLDVIVLAGLYTLRVLAGAAVIAVTPSFWLLSLSMFIFLSLALVKRYSELALVARSQLKGAHGRGYELGDLQILQSMGIASGYLAVMVLALYINNPDVRHLYGTPYGLWGLCPLLLWWISRVWMKAHRGEMHHDPVVFAAKDQVSLVICGLCVLCVLLSAY